MKYKVHLEKKGSYFQARCGSLPCVSTAPNREEALEKLKKEILFYLQSCPCDQVPDAAIELEEGN